MFPWLVCCGFSDFCQLPWYLKQTLSPTSCTHSASGTGGELQECVLWSRDMVLVVWEHGDGACLMIDHDLAKEDARQARPRSVGDT